MTEYAPQAHNDNPLLIFKIGMLGSAPLDMTARLAEAYDTRIVSSDHIRNEIAEAREAEGMEPRAAQRVKFGEISNEMIARSQTHLEAGDDVMVDMFYNARDTRKTLLDMGRQVGATSLALCVSVRPAVAYQRVREWMKQDDSASFSRWSVSPLVTAKKMAHSVVWPKREREGIDHIVWLAGDEGTDSILNQYEGYLRRVGLTEQTD
jgi:predicted kinase